MTDHGPGEMSNLPAWLQLFIATVTGAAAAVITLVKLGFSFNNRLQRIENQDLDNIIDRRISDDWHNNRAPMLQTRIFADLDKMEILISSLSRDVAVLMERDRLNQRMEQVIAALNAAASAVKPPS